MLRCTELLLQRSFKRRSLFGHIPVCRKAAAQAVLALGTSFLSLLGLEKLRMCLLAAETLSTAELHDIGWAYAVCIDVNILGGLSVLWRWASCSGTCCCIFLSTTASRLQGHVQAMQTPHARLSASAGRWHHRRPAEIREKGRVEGVAVWRAMVVGRAEAAARWLM